MNYYSISKTRDRIKLMKELQQEIQRICRIRQDVISKEDVVEVLELVIEHFNKIDLEKKT